MIHCSLQVLLFNFFEDSTVDLSQWRVVLGAIETGQVNHVLNVPQFDELRHAGVCTEVSHQDINSVSLNFSLSLVKIPLRCYHKSTKKSMDCRLFREGRTYAGELYILPLFKFSFKI